MHFKNFVYTAFLLALTATALPVAQSDDGSDDNSSDSSSDSSIVDSSVAQSGPAADSPSINPLTMSPSASVDCSTCVMLVSIHLSHQWSIANTTDRLEPLISFIRTIPNARPPLKRLS